MMSAIGGNYLGHRFTRISTDQNKYKRTVPSHNYLPRGIFSFFEGF